MADGRHVHVGAVAGPRAIPLGTWVSIGGRTYQVEDRTARRFDGRFDIWMPSRTAALRFGKRQLKVNILSNDRLPGGRDGAGLIPGRRRPLQATAVEQAAGANLPSCVKQAGCPAWGFLTPSEVHYGWTDKVPACLRQAGRHPVRVRRLVPPATGCTA